MSAVSLPSAHAGEVVVEPHLADADGPAALVGPRQFRRVGTVRAARMGRPFFVMVDGRREVGNAGDWLLEDESGGRHVVDAESFELLFEEA